MNRNLQKVTALVLIALFAWTLTGTAEAKDKRMHDFVMYVRSNKTNLRGLDKKYVLAEDLGRYYGINIRSVKDGKAAMVGHLLYDQRVRPYKGKAYIKATDFFKFFNIPYKKVNDWTYRVKFTNVPMFDLTLHRFFAGGQVTLEGSKVPMDYVTVRDRKYIKMETLLNSLKISPSKSTPGTVVINGKRIKHWLTRGGKKYVYVEEAAVAAGKSIR